MVLFYCGKVTSQIYHGLKWLVTLKNDNNNVIKDTC